MTEVLKGTISIPPTVAKRNRAIASRCWWRAISTSGPCMSCALPLAR